jgi:hypothetical protein
MLSNTKQLIQIQLYPESATVRDQAQRLLTLALHNILTWRASSELLCRHRRFKFPNDDSPFAYCRTYWCWWWRVPLQGVSYQDKFIASKWQNEWRSPKLLHLGSVHCDMQVRIGPIDGPIEWLVIRKAGIVLPRNWPARHQLTVILLTCVPNGSVQNIRILNWKWKYHTSYDRLSSHSV